MIIRTLLTITIGTSIIIVVCVYVCCSRDVQRRGYHYDYEYQYGGGNGQSKYDKF